MAKFGKEFRPCTGKMRCAIYTRKSSEEGLEQAFNSLDAQREACAAFVHSQKHEGWVVLPALYDDGGFSGGTMARPALQRLFLGDIRAGQVDVVVVYKIDRLTRSLFDFAKIVEAFDARGVLLRVDNPAVQHHNLYGAAYPERTALLPPNLSGKFAGERIRDKIAASKKKGMWRAVAVAWLRREEPKVGHQRGGSSHGRPYLSAICRASIRAACCRLNLMPREFESKLRILAGGTPFGGQKLSRGALYLMLQNRIYRGAITHKGNAYPAEHRANCRQGPLGPGSSDPRRKSGRSRHRSGSETT